MRRIVKQEIYSILRTLKKAHTRIWDMYESGREDEMFLLLKQSQACAIEIGNTIEQQEGQGTKAVSYLEDYCEKLFLFSQIQKGKKTIESIIQMNDSLRLIENEVKENLTNDKLKILFLPYKASMWDCMASIWEAAEIDNECQAFVVPIPYYEKDNSGGISKECYEGDLFPDYVPIISYREYNLDIEYPDVIYIHNPYDGANYVTSVHSNYYSNNLKKYTDVLVYVPYYINGTGPMAKSHRELPAYRNADYIILQDEEKKASLLGHIPEEKMLVLGNPKVDRLLQLKGCRKKIVNQEIPVEWRLKIADKKVFLFNVSITGILENSLCAIKKIKYVLSKFVDSQEAVLLWRPHPLIEATLKSMRPELYREYMEIKMEFIKMDQGILDETQDITKAIIISDAYIGENTSSVIHYFGVLGKPVYFINWKKTEEPTEDERQAYYTYDFFYEDGYIYFVPYNKEKSHFLCKMNLHTGVIETVALLPGCENNYICIKKINHKILLIPASVGDIYVYDTDMESAVKLVVQEENCKDLLFDRVLEYNSNFYLTPKCYPAIIKFNLDSYQMTKYSECIKVFRNEERKDVQFKDLTFMRAIHEKDNLLYLFSSNDARVLIFNRDTGEYSIKKIGEFDYGFLSLAYDGQYYWLSAYKANVVLRWDEKTGESLTYHYQLQDEENIFLSGAFVLNDGDRLLLFHACERNIISMKKDNGCCERIVPSGLEIQKEGMVLGKPHVGFKFAEQLADGNIIAFDGFDCSILYWDKRTENISRYPCRLKREDMLHTEKQVIEKNKLYKGCPMYITEMDTNLTEFIDYICGSQYLYSEQGQEYYGTLIANFFEGAGEKIHQYIKKLSFSKFYNIRKRK